MSGRRPQCRRRSCARGRPGARGRFAVRALRERRRTRRRELQGGAWRAPGADRSQRRREDDADRCADRLHARRPPGAIVFEGVATRRACARTGWRGAAWSAAFSQSSCSTTSPSRRTSRSLPSRPACSGALVSVFGVDGEEWRRGRRAGRSRSPGLADVAERYPTELSHGQRKLVGVGRALALPPVAAVARRARRRTGHRRDARPRPPPAVAPRARRHRAAHRPRYRLLPTNFRLCWRFSAFARFAALSFSTMAVFPCASLVPAREKCRGRRRRGIGCGLFVRFGI